MRHTDSAKKKMQNTADQLNIMMITDMTNMMKVMEGTMIMDIIKKKKDPHDAGPF